MTTKGAQLTDTVLDDILKALADWELIQSMPGKASLAKQIPDLVNNIRMARADSERLMHITTKALNDKHVLDAEVISLRRDNKALQAEIEKLREALAFYGDEETWSTKEDFRGYLLKSKLADDRGQRAREALENDF